MSDPAWSTLETFYFPSRRNYFHWELWWSGILVGSCFFLSAGSFTKVPHHLTNLFHQLLLFFKVLAQAVHPNSWYSNRDEFDLSQIFSNIDNHRSTGLEHGSSFTFSFSPFPQRTKPLGCRNRIIFSCKTNCIPNFKSIFFNNCSLQYNFGEQINSALILL